LLVSLARNGKTERGTVVKIWIEVLIGTRAVATVKRSKPIAFRRPSLPTNL
jgi:hypothetical protein